MTRDEVRSLMEEIAGRAGGRVAGGDEQLLRDVPFRSIDFSELALLVEEARGTELVFDAAVLREITTVGDVLDFFDQAAAAPA